MTGQQALILPCLGRIEIDEQATGPQHITVEDSMSMVHHSAGQNISASDELKSVVAIVAGIAETILGNGIINWSLLKEDYSLIRDESEAVIPTPPIIMRK